MSSLQKLSRRKSQARRNLWFERIMASLTLLNLLIVIFDLSYIPLRDFWLQHQIKFSNFTLNLTKWYDPVKGIEPYRDTQQYLERVNALERQIKETGRQGLRSAEVQELLQDLRRRSEEIIDTNPFESANKIGTLEKIKNRMRQHIFRSRDTSAKDAFRVFWSEDYLAKNGPAQELDFFNREIRSLFETNYYRPIGENGKSVDYFWHIDLPFIILFALEFLGRTWLISRRRTAISWLDAMLWRWYDIFLLLPFFRWLRIIPVTIRLNQAKVLDLDPIQKQISQGFAASIAEDLTEVVVIRVINQVQSSINRGDIAKWLAQREVRPYIDLNNTDEVATLTSIVIQLTVYQVLPKIQPDVEALLQHNIARVLSQSPAFQGLQHVPGLMEIQNQLTESLAKQITQGVYDGLNGLLEEDPVGDKLFQRLIQHLSEALGSEIQTKKTLQQIQSLLIDLLEEVKINYVERLSEEDLEDILDQTRAIRQIAQQ